MNAAAELVALDRISVQFDLGGGGFFGGTLCLSGGTRWRGNSLPYGHRRVRCRPCRPNDRLGLAEAPKRNARESLRAGGDGAGTGFGRELRLRHVRSPDVQYGSESCCLARVTRSP